MLKFGPTGFDLDFLSSPEVLNLTEWLDAFPADGWAGVPAMAVDNPLTGLSLQLDSGFLNALFAEDDATAGGDGADPGKDIAPGLGTGASNDGPEFTIAAAGAFDPGDPGFFAIQAGEDSNTGFHPYDLPVDAISFSAGSGLGANGAPADGGVAFIDLGFSSAKGGNGGGKGGGKDKDDDPNVLSTYTSGDADTDIKDYYNITINFEGDGWTETLQTGFKDSSELISDLITDGATDIFFRGKVIDDIRIEAELFYDAESGVLGWGGPEWYRTADGQPLTASMGFNLFYTPGLITDGTWGDVVFHEIMHSIGFGTMWDYQGLLSGGGTDNPRFTGDRATAIYVAAGGDSGGVPLEQDGGSGTNDSHWNEIGFLDENEIRVFRDGETTFDDEIMTGYINNDGNYLSDMTVASLADFGYETLWDENPINDELWSPVVIFIA